MLKLYSILLFIFILEFIFGAYYITNSSLCIVFYIVCSILFILQNRKASIVCPELLFFLFSFIIFFYKEIVIDNVEFISTLFSQFSDKQYVRGRCLNMIAFFSYLLGASMQSCKHFDCDRRLNVITQINIEIMSRYFPYILTVFLILSILLGKISLVNHYANAGIDFSNTYIVFYTVLYVVNTTAEFIRLNNIGVLDFRQFIAKVNRIYFFQSIIFIFILLNIGYRSGVILCILPIILCYSLMICRISFRYFFLILLSGIFFMVIVGYVRSGDEISSDSFTVYDSFRDFGPAYLTNTGLISYTDIHGALGIGMGLRTLFSSVPFLGGIIDVIFPSSYSIDDQSAVLATKLFQERNNLGSGLGTSLVGDLYFSGHLFWVVAYMFTIGNILSYCYDKIFVKRQIGIYSMILYIWMFSYSVFLTRAEWYSYFRYIGFSWIIIYVLKYIYTKKK